jgi:hypothetical protein
VLNALSGFAKPHSFDTNIIYISLSQQMMFQGAKGSAEVSINSKQANRTLLLKQLARDLCISERRILYRSQYVSQQSFLFSARQSGYTVTPLIFNLWSGADIA